MGTPSLTKLRRDFSACLLFHIRRRHAINNPRMGTANRRPAHRQEAAATACQGVLTPSKSFPAPSQTVVALRYGDVSVVEFWPVVTFTVPRLIALATFGKFGVCCSCRTHGHRWTRRESACLHCPHTRYALSRTTSRLFLGGIPMRNE